MHAGNWAVAGILASIVGLSAAPARAALVFSDNFESGLGQWTPAGSAQIVTDPLGGPNNVVRFTALGSGGDAFTGISTPGLFAAGRYTLSVDILGTCSGGVCGGFIGIDGGGHPVNPEQWLIGDSSYAANFTLINDGAWQHVSMSFDSRNYFAGSFALKMEDFIWSGTAGDVFFDNLRLETVPEPTSLALLGLALATLGASRRTSKRS